MFFAPFPEKGILDLIAHRPIIQVFTVVQTVMELGGGEGRGRNGEWDAPVTRNTVRGGVSFFLKA